MIQNRKDIALYIVAQLQKNKTVLQQQFQQSSGAIGYFVLDDVLPKKLATQIHASFPKLEETVKKKNIREFKYQAYQMDKYNPLLEEVIYAFQEEAVVHEVSEICGVIDVHPDAQLYAGGLSIMDKGNYLNPHLDNSHDKDRNLWRVFNLLYYVTPNWQTDNGGNLELWPKGVVGHKTTITSKFNRLVVMATHQNSWHSVSKVQVDALRCCVSNYYFSETPLLATDQFHVTSFRGRKNQLIKDVLLRIDSKLRTGVRKLFKKGIRENPHRYKKTRSK